MVSSLRSPPRSTFCLPHCPSRHCCALLCPVLCLCWTKSSASARRQGSGGSKSYPSGSIAGLIYWPLLRAASMIESAMRKVEEGSVSRSRAAIGARKQTGPCGSWRYRVSHAKGKNAGAELLLRTGSIYSNWYLHLGHIRYHASPDRSSMLFQMLS